MRVSTVFTLSLLAGMQWIAAASDSKTPPRRSQIGQEAAVPHHLADGEEFRIDLAELLARGKNLFTASWTKQDGAGRPLTKGTGQRLSDQTRPLAGTRAFNRISGPDANSCLGCHNRPSGFIGGAGDFVSNVFQLAERFDFVTFASGQPNATSLQTVGNVRSSPSLLGAGYVEMLARQITEDLQRTRDSLAPNRAAALVSKGISFGVLARRADGTWDARRVEGLPSQSMLTAAGKPSLVIRPWHQSGSTVSLREFTNSAYNLHHGIQTMERFGGDTDPDGDGVVNEMTRADVSAVVVFQATLPVPGRVIPTDPDIERAVITGERLFESIQCSRCHLPALPLERRGWIYSEPGPYNPVGNLRRGEARVLDIDLTNAMLPQPRLLPSDDHPTVIQVPAYSDFKLHDITDPRDAGANEPVDMNERVGSLKFIAGNRRFLTRRLWGVASQPNHFHHGLFTTVREAVLAHSGEALGERNAFQSLSADDQSAVIEFLKSLQMLPPGTRDLVVDEYHRTRSWPPARLTSRVQVVR